MKKTLLLLVLATILSMLFVQTMAFAATDAPPSVDNPFDTGPPALTIADPEPEVIPYEPPPEPPATPASGPELIYVLTAVMALGLGTFAYKQVKANK